MAQEYNTVDLIYKIPPVWQEYSHGNNIKCCTLTHVCYFWFFQAKPKTTDVLFYSWSITFLFELQTAWNRITVPIRASRHWLYQSHLLHMLLSRFFSIVMIDLSWRKTRGENRSVHERGNHCPIHLNLWNTNYHLLRLYWSRNQKSKFWTFE